MKILSCNGKIKKTMLLIPLLAMSVFPGLTGAESASNEELAKQSIKNYVEAAQSGDVSEAAKWVVDTRFNSEEEQLKEYKESLSSTPFSDVSIKNVVSASDATYSDPTYTATVELTRKDDGSINTVTYPIIKKGDSWKVLLGGQETKSKKVEKLIQSQSEENSTSSVKPLSIELTSYGSGTQWVSSGASIYSGQFNMTEDRVGIAGWQQIPGGTSKCAVRYSIVKKGIFGDDAYGQVFQTGFNYWNGAAFYNTIYTGNQYSGVHVRATNEELGNTVKLRGHVYGN
ncbi:UNVERIFIED_CONTAM: type II secretory pathway pseudopilin PulG [Paenibacillus sp. PvR008]